MPRDRLSKEELHDDEFTSAIFRLITYTEENYPKILAGLGAVVVASLIGFFIQDNANKRTQAALDAIGDVQVALMQGNMSSAITIAQAVASDYSGETIGGRAILTLANIYFDQGRFEESSAQYHKFLDGADDPSGPEVYGATAVIASCMESQGNPLGAGQHLLSYADSHSQPPYVPLALMEAARSYLAGGNPDRAKETLQRVIGDYPESAVNRAAKTELGILGIHVD